MKSHRQKILANFMLHKGPVFRIYEELSYLTGKQSNEKVENLTRHFTKEDTQMAKKT